MSQLVCLGKILSPHGIRGQVKVLPFTENPENIISYGPLTDKRGERQFSLRIVAEQKQHLIVAIEGVTNRNDAEKLRGIELFVSKDLLPETEEEEFYHHDLINLKVVLTDKTRYGTIKSVQNFGAGDLLEIALSESKKTVFLPFTKAIVPEIHLSEGYVIIVPPEEVIAKEQ